MSPRPDVTPVVTPPDVEGVARIIGGVGGVRFQWEELDRGARILSDASAELSDVAEVIGWIDVRLSSLQVLMTGHGFVDPQSYLRGAAAREAVGVARQRILGISSELKGTGDRIRRSRFAYEAADAVVRGVIGDLTAETGPGGSLPLMISPLMLEHRRTESARVDGTLDNLLTHVSHAAGEPGNAFEILEVEGESGPTYVVVIPGSEGRGWAEPFSYYGVGEARFGNSEYVHDAVLRALGEVGAPEDARVVLMGYSQGGMHAMNLANSGPLAEKYAVGLVVTAGSPVEREAAPERTSYLHLAHTWDFVPHADFVPQEDRPNQVSVVLDHPTQLQNGESVGFGPAHKVNSYREGAQAIDASSHPSLVPITAALGTALAGSTARRHVFQVTRPPLLGPYTAPAAAPANGTRGREGLAPGSGDRSRDK